MTTTLSDPDQPEDDPFHGLTLGEFFEHLKRTPGGVTHIGGFRTEYVGTYDPVLGCWTDGPK